jgi:hypothetical protein
LPHPKGITIITSSPTADPVLHWRHLLTGSFTLHDLVEDLCCQSDETRANAVALRRTSRAAGTAVAQARARTSHVSGGRPRDQPGLP